MSLTRRDALRVGAGVATGGFAGCLGDRRGQSAGGEGAAGVGGPLIETLGTPGSPAREIPLVADTPLTLLYFFATWCAPCKPQNESLAEVATQTDDTVAMRAISPETDVELVREYWTDSPSTFPAAIDAELAIHDEYDVTGYPTLVLLDSGGSVRWRRTGLADAETILAVIEDER